MSKENSEKYAFISLSLCYDKRLADMNYIDIKKESPDFQIQDESKNLSIGIEITEALNNLQGEERFVKNRYFGKNIPADKIIADITKRFGKKIGKKFRNIDNTAVYSYNDKLFDIDIFIEELKNSIIEKTGKLDNYKIFNNNWLYVFSRTSLLNIDDIKKLISAVEIKFDKIFINCIDKIFIIDTSKNVSYVNLNNLTLKLIEDKV